MAHIWFMHDAHLGYALFFLDMLAEYTLLSMTVMVTPCLWYVVGMNLVCPMSKFPQAPFARAPFGECPHEFTDTKIGNEKNMTATDVTGFCAFSSIWKSGNFLHILGRFPTNVHITPGEKGKQSTGEN